jgi:hypothetical protein
LTLLKSLTRYEGLKLRDLVYKLNFSCVSFSDLKIFLVYQTHVNFLHVCTPVSAEVEVAEARTALFFLILKESSCVLLPHFVS